MKINNYNYIKNNHKAFKSNYPEIKYVSEITGSVSRLYKQNMTPPLNKLIMGTFFLCLQPIVDLLSAEEDKKVDSAIKSASKNIVGTITGVSIRAFFIQLFKSKIRFSRPGEIGFREKQNELTLARNFICNLLGPRNLVKELHASIKPDTEKIKPITLEKARIEFEKKLKKYNTTMGNIFAILTMALITNKILDAPITSDVQDLLGKIIKENKTFKISALEVLKERKEKTINSIKNIYTKICELKTKKYWINVIENLGNKENKK